MNPIVLIIVLIIVIAVLPSWPYSRDWNYGYYPSGGLGLILLILFILWLLGRL